MVICNISPVEHMMNKQGELVCIPHLFLFPHILQTQMYTAKLVKLQISQGISPCTSLNIYYMKHAYIYRIILCQAAIFEKSS
jgi:hypothetical protein